MDLHCLNCVYEPEWDFQTVTMKYNHTVSMGWCKFDQDYELPPAYDKHRVCVVVPDNPEKEVEFGVVKHGSICYMNACGGWRPSEKFLEMPGFAPGEVEDATTHV